MEEYAITAQLEASRARLRALLLPDPVTGRIEADVFPRSAVMRFVLDSRTRRVAMKAAPILMMMAGRKVMSRRRGSSRRQGLLPRMARTLGTVAQLVRR